MFTSDFVLKNPVNVWINKVRRGVFHYPGIVKCNHSSPIYIIVFSLLDFLFIVLIKKIMFQGDVHILYSKTNVQWVQITENNFQK